MNTPESDQTPSSQSSEESVPTKSDELIKVYEARKEQLDQELGRFMTAMAGVADENLRYKKPEPTPEETTSSPHISSWTEAALRGEPFRYNEVGGTPKTKLDWLRAERYYDIKKHLGTLTATLAVEEDGVYQIGKDGKSALRVNGSLEHLPRSLQKSIEKTEKNYKKISEKQKHAHHKLEPGNN